MISVCILAKNSEKTIKATLDSVQTFAEVLILDNGSTDKTLEIARQYPNVQIFESPFIGFGPLRNKAASLAKNDWILALDTDEVLSPPLLKELEALSLNSNTTYSMPRANYYNGKHIKGCGWHSDRVIRLYDKQKTHYSNAAVHESVIPLKIYRLTAPIIHVPFRTTTEFLVKMQQYSTLYATQNAQIKSSSFSKAFLHSLFSFFRSYFIQKGFLLGREGFIISLYNSNTVFYKYLKLSEWKL